LADHPALLGATAQGFAVLPVFIWSPEEEGTWAQGAASRWWLHHSLEGLDAALRRRGSRLVIRRGPSLDALRQLAQESGARAVFWSRRYEPAVLRRDAALKAALSNDGIEARDFGGTLLFEPADIRSQADRPFRVFTPFWRACLAAAPPVPPQGAPRRIAVPERWPGSLGLEALDLEPKVDWAGGLRKAWKPGEAGGRRALRRFLDCALDEYAVGRDFPSRAGTSRLSPHLHFGEISPRQVWYGVLAAAANAPGLSAHSEAFLRELGWREFGHHVLYHVPETAKKPLRPEFAAFPWQRSPRMLEAWRRGRTGYPMVDAGMRELWKTGWLHNRSRMVVASFLVKHLLIPWQVGAAWFWDTLVDADLANNTLGWQWSAGCGADAAPYFRIFNPVIQGETFDPGGDYVRHWVPELARLPDQWIHRPWKAPEAVLAAAGVELGRTYPTPVIEHAIARQRALAAFSHVMKSGHGPVGSE
jgi:deoxyribodipyrimidine photo-lyase